MCFTVKFVGCYSDCFWTTFKQNKDKEGERTESQNLNFTRKTGQKSICNCSHLHKCFFMFHLYSCYLLLPIVFIFQEQAQTVHIHPNISKHFGFSSSFWHLAFRFATTSLETRSFSEDSLLRVLQASRQSKSSWQGEPEVFSEEQNCES